MARGLEVAGLGLVAIMILSFVGALRPAVDAGTSYVFWGCAAGALGIIIYRKMKNKKEDAKSQGGEAGA